MSKCFNPDCNNQTTNPKFCSRSCSVIYNNKIKPKRTLKKLCIDCKKPIRANSIRCRECNFRLRPIYNRLNELPRRDQTRYNIVRSQARLIYQKSLRPTVCYNCGYDKHIHICHIQAISNFPQDALISDVNDINNLIALCPNCHWEFDNKLLKL